MSDPRHRHAGNKRLGSTAPVGGDALRTVGARSEITMIDELRGELRLIDKTIAALIRLSGLRQTKEGAKRRGLIKRRRLRSLRD